MTDIIKQLTKKPPSIPRGDYWKVSTRPTPNITNDIQADLLFLPEDKGFKYLLSVVDIGNKKFDGEPIKDKEPSSVKEGFQKIFKRGIVKFPKLQAKFDSGSEFKSEVKDWFEKNNVLVTTARTGRHDQIGNVEQRNQEFGKQVSNEQLRKELLSGEVNREWVGETRKIVNNINANARKAVKSRSSGAIKCSNNGNTCELLPIGQEVYVKLEEPRSATEGTRLHGKFRTGDLRYEIFPRKIVSYRFKPNSTPRYVVSGIPHTLFHRNELLPAKKGEFDSLKKEGEEFETGVVEAIEGKRKKGNTVEYLVKFRGDPPKWLPNATFKDAGKRAKQLIKTFNAEESKKTVVKTPVKKATPAKKPTPAKKKATPAKKKPTPAKVIKTKYGRVVKPRKA